MHACLSTQNFYGNFYVVFASEQAQVGGVLHLGGLEGGGGYKASPPPNAGVGLQCLFFKAAVLVSG